MLDEFLNTYSSYETRKSYRSRLYIFLEYLWALNIKIDDITPDLVEVFVKNKSVLTQNAIKTAIRTYYKFCTGKDLPIDNQQVNSYRPDRNLSLNEAQKMLDKTPNYRDKLIIKILVETGIRIQELCNLTKSNIVYEDGDYYLKFRAKGNKLRTIKLDQEQKNLLSKYNSGKKTILGVGKRQVERIIKKIGEKIIHRVVTPHCFRHCYATELMRQGVSFGKIQELMGHDNISTTLKYLHNEINGNECSVKLKM